MRPCCIAQGTHGHNLNRKETQKEGDMCMCMAGSFCCTVEANTTL